MSINTDYVTSSSLGSFIVVVVVLNTIVDLCVVDSKPRLMSPIIALTFRSQKERGT